MDFIKAEEKEGFFLLKIGGPLSPISHNPSCPFSLGQSIADFCYFFYSCIKDPPHLTGDEDTVQSTLVEWTGQRTVPNVFINGKHIDGCNNVTMKHNDRKLVPLLTEAAAIANASS